MIGESKEDIAQQPNKGLIALRDALVVFFLFLITRLVEAGYPPSVEVLYTSALAGGLMALISYMRSLGIKKPEA